MHTSFAARRAVQGLVMAFFFSFGMAMAQTEPSMSQIYATAQSGKLAEAQTMVQQVLVLHPKSAKAFFVQAELYSRQGQLDRARESLSMAEKLAPGLPFAKPEAVQALRTQMASPRSNLAVGGGSVAHSSVAPVAPAAPAHSGSWALPLLLAAGVVVAGYFIFRKRAPASMAQQPVYANQNGLNGPQTFGMGAGGGMPPGYPQQPGYYPQQAGSGLGGRIMGGVATGLAVGAGVMAAEAIGRNLMGNHNSTGSGSTEQLGNNDYRPIDSNPDMGGDNFGINDAGSWDDGGSVDSGGGSDWDN